MKPVSSEPDAGCRSGSIRSPASGFSIVEGIGYLVVFALLMGALAYGMGSLISQQAHPIVTYNGQVYERAPSFNGFQQAIDLHVAFSNAVDAADNVVVLGGSRSHPQFDNTESSSVLSESFGDTALAAMTDIDADPFGAFSSYDQKGRNYTQFTPYLSTTQDPADFTILTVQGLSHITSITQQRRYTATISGQDLHLYEVTHQTVDWSSGGPVLTANADTGTPPTFSYRFYYGSAEDVWTMKPGAAHNWYRTDATWDRDQEGPTRVVFADPCSLAGQDPSSPVSALSRFVYFLPQIR